MDVRDEQSVATGFLALREASERLDVLVSNAVGGGQPVERAGRRRWRTVLDTNRHVLVTSALPLLNNSGRIVSTSSVLERFGVPGLPRAVPQAR